MNRNLLSRRFEGMNNSDSVCKKAQQGGMADIAVGWRSATRKGKKIFVDVLHVPCEHIEITLVNIGDGLTSW